MDEDEERRVTDETSWILVGMPKTATYRIHLEGSKIQEDKVYFDNLILEYWIDMLSGNVDKKLQLCAA
jgi:hypothetical protein